MTTVRRGAAAAEGQSASSTQPDVVAVLHAAGPATAAPGRRSQGQRGDGQGSACETRQRECPASRYKPKSS